MTENVFDVQASEEPINYDGDAFGAVEVDNGGKPGDKID